MRISSRCTNNMFTLRGRGTTICVCSASLKPSRTSASSASPLPWSGSTSDVRRALCVSRSQVLCSMRWHKSCARSGTLRAI
jgi:hypothetical protein